jgi:hypothetical protein
MGLRNNGPRADSLTPLAPGVTRSTNLSHSPLRCWAVRGLRQSALANRLACAINVEDHALFARPIDKPADLALLTQGASQQIGEKQGTQGFDRSRGQSTQKARERRARGQALAPEEGHERLRPGSKLLVKLLQGAFATNGVAEEYGEKVDHLVVPKAAAGKANLRGDGIEDAKLAKMMDDEHYFPQPTGGRGHRSRRGLDDHRRISDTGHVYLLHWKDLYPFLKGGTFYACSLQDTSRCAIRGPR